MVLLTVRTALSLNTYDIIEVLGRRPLSRSQMRISPRLQRMLDGGFTDLALRKQSIHKVGHQRVIRNAASKDVALYMSVHYEFIRDGALEYDAWACR